MKNKLVFLVIVSLFAANAAYAGIAADILWVVDTSGSMGSDIAQVKTRITEFDTAMTNAGIDARYGLVRFGGPETLIQNLSTFATFNTSSAFTGLTANGGGTERGSAAVTVGLDGLNHRAGAVTNVILVTDEDDDSTVQQFDAALAALTQHNALYNVIGSPGYGNSNTRYGNPTNSTGPAYDYGGKFFNILDFRSAPQTFFTNFTTTKVKEIIEHQNPTIPAPAAILLGTLGTGLVGMLRRRFA